MGISHSEALKWCESRFRNGGLAGEVNFALLGKDGTLDKFNSEPCFGILDQNDDFDEDDSEHQDTDPNLYNGIYLIVGKTRRDYLAMDFDECEPNDAVRKVITQDLEKSIKKDYLTFVLHRKKSPWRKLLSKRVIFKDGEGTIQMVFFPITKRTDLKFLVNCMSAVRATWYNFGSVYAWYKAKQQGCNDYEALYLAMHLIIDIDRTGEEKVKLRRYSNHFFHDPISVKTCPKRLAEASPALDDNKYQAWVLYGYSRVWADVEDPSQIEKKPGWSASIKSNHLFPYLADDKSIYCGLFKKAYDNSKTDSVTQLSISNPKDVFSRLMSRKNEWGLAA